MTTQYGIKNAIYDGFVKHSNWIFCVSSIMILLFLTLDNANNYLLEHYPGKFCDFLHYFLWILFTASVVLFPVGTVFYFRRKPFAFSWLLLIGITFLAAISSTFGFRHPYIDDPYMNLPVKNLLDTWSTYYVLSAFVQGGIMTAFYLIFRKRFKAEDKQCCRKTSIILTSFVILFTIAALVGIFYFMP